MWALRRASANSFRAQGLNLTASRASSGLGPFSLHAEDKSSNLECRGFTVDRLATLNTCQCAIHFPNQYLVGSRGLSSQAGAKSGGEGDDELEEGFSDIEAPEASNTTAEGDKASGTSESESDLSDADDFMEESMETELMEDAKVDGGETVLKKTSGPSPLLNLIRNESVQSISGILDNYFPEEKVVSHDEIYEVMHQLKKRKNYVRVMQLSEWLEKREGFDFTERDYASRLDMIAKLRGLQQAEQYMHGIPKSHRQELVYITFLANCASQINVAKSEEIFNKIKDLGFTVTAFAYNQLLKLYKRTDKKKIADVLLMMEKEDVKPTIFTYQLLIDTKGLSNDIAGMEQILEIMQAEGVKPGVGVQTTLARHYAYTGHKEKAAAVLEEIEGDDLNSNWWVCHILLPIYANLGKVDDVERVWKVCESKPREVDFLAAIGAWGKLKNIERAEAVFEMMTKSIKQLSTRHYSVMLKVYAQNKMLSKGEQLLKQMGESGCHVRPHALNSLVKLYVDAGEVEKADSVLHKATQQNSQKPLFTSYMSILEQYAKRGDIHNAEKIFHRMRQTYYVYGARPFSALLVAYANAKAPAYGLRERMKADNIFPNKMLTEQLAQVDVFKKTAVSDLLD